MIKRVILLIFDACGVGALPDAADYGDSEAATIPNIARELNGLKMPNCQKLGLGNIIPINGLRPAERPVGSYGKMAAKSVGKDSTSGHWEIAGVILDRRLPVFPNGFPPKLVEKFEKKAGVKTIGNCTASGTEIIDKLGQQHKQTGEIILYTSADSVFQLAAHEDIIPLNRLYEICQIARELLTGQHAVGRVIARPFIGQPGQFIRTSNRKDFSLEPATDTILDKLTAKKIPVVSIGKIYDLFAGRGFSKKISAKNNNEVMAKVIDELTKTDYGLIFANLVDFDMLWGHRNDTKSFGHGLEAADKELGKLLEKLKEDDLLIITADHGCDPTLKYSTDHTREYVPLLVYNKRMKTGKNLGRRETFSDISSTLAEIFEIDNVFQAKSFLSELSI
jgi:phosphopentomutase